MLMNEALQLKWVWARLAIFARRPSGLVNATPIIQLRYCTSVSPVEMKIKLGGRYVRQGHRRVSERSSFVLGWF